MASNSEFHIVVVGGGIGGVATAMGLFAAIPAVIGYNRFSARVEVLMKRYEAFSDELTTILHRAAHAKN